MNLRSCAISDVGRKRQKNEDSYLINDELRLFIVADGMGGHAGGEYASRIAITTIEESFKTASTEQLNFPEKLIESAIVEAGGKIVQKAEEDRALRGMGTTVVALCFSDKKAILGHVGDSRAYLFRDGILEQLTEDHSLVNEQVKSGLISAEEARNHQFKNIITRSLGVTAEVEVDLISKKLKAGDVILLCSDGLSNLVELSEMEKELRDRETVLATKAMVDLANKRGGDDNITTIVVEVVEV
ncbi:MAG: Stp1/IreP family PP2C-type Ser/Thr phosphatase [Bradymonadales bacterium]|nr:MAG: Stp1/IreP family PP2C-type Ser/Thr phosphatase [Bradymonadales bacterium]